MMTPPHAPSPQFIQTHAFDAQAMRAELVAGLHGKPARVSPKFLYDALGSRLFEAITELPEYYPTRTEAAIFAAHAAAIAQAAGTGRTLVDLGAGNCEKAARLFTTLRPAQYVAVDISVDFLRTAVSGLALRFPDVPMLGLGQDFSQRLELPPEVNPGRRLFFYPGSSLGNFTPTEARAFLKGVRSLCDGEGALLIGIDLVKDEATLAAAYDDPLGVTAAFNLNLLRNINGIVGADFDLRDWMHVALFNARESRIEMHLQAKRDVAVRLPGGTRRFAEGERIHTENSYKYRLPQVEALLRSAGFGTPTVWTDEREWFAVCYAAAV